MERTKSVLKRQRQENQNYLRNSKRKTQMKNAVKKVLESKTKVDAEASYNNAVSIIDKLSNKGIIHKNSAARRKSQITRHLNSLN
ncbi:MAG: 30S ribosomal protein S20 [Candidatus Marinimicrobia bacterium]|jgi:small subunit ribosomal protein S20|nr:30S ribosomal protein S20 [Candidatus Neomarinimicrobiota bacterium]MDP7025848.1 30S ribosomal protein S20 [Candidatus Neomarinimicrobiota bacterium]|tara:strand:- start:5958 stop:6212 length:255 start_codon:yes stop_codon:yes gene_type:complete